MANFKLIKEINKIPDKEFQIGRWNSRDYDVIIGIKYYEPHDEERMQHFNEFAKELDKLYNLSDFNYKRTRNVVKKGRRLLQKEVSHLVRVEQPWYDEIEDVLLKYGEDVDKYKKIYGQEGLFKYDNPLLYSGKEKVVDRPAVHSEESTIVHLNIPHMYGGKLFLTDERIKWIIEQLSF